MKTVIEYHEMLDNIRGKVIAIVYNFRKESASGYSIYESWKSDVISSWMVAVDELGAIPLVLDARTFIVSHLSEIKNSILVMCNATKQIRKTLTTSYVTKMTVRFFKSAMEGVYIQTT